MFDSDYISARIMNERECACDNAPMTTRACIALASIAAVYSLVFLVPGALLAPALAQQVTAVALPVLIIAALVFVRKLGLWELCALGLARSHARRALKASLSYAVVLAIPLANLVFSWGRAPSILLLLWFILLCAAVIEELCFRGLLMGAFHSSGMRPLVNVGITSFLFAALHFLNVGTLPFAYVAAQFVIALCLGAAYGFMRLGTRSIYPCIVAHVLVNATAANPISVDGAQLVVELILAIAAGACCFAWWKRTAKRSDRP